MILKEMGGFFLKGFGFFGPPISTLFTVIYMPSAQPLRCMLCGNKASNPSLHKRRRTAKQQSDEFVCFACRDNLIPPDEYRCKGTTTKKERCKHWVLNFPTQYCHAHKKQENLK